MKEIIRLIEARLNGHQTHIEDLVVLGEEGLNELTSKVRNLASILEGSSAEPMNITTKIDGSPAVFCYSDFNGLKNGIVLKSFLNCITERQLEEISFFTPAQITQKYGDRPDMCEKLIALLNHITDGTLKFPQGEVWQGDLLFSQSTIDSFTNDEGDNYVTFQPNTILYAVPANSDSAQQIKKSDIGVAFHTKYSGYLGNIQQSFSVSTSLLESTPENAYIIDAQIPNLSGQVSFTAEESDVLKEMIEELEEAKSQLLGEYKEQYEEICANEKFIKFYFQTYQNKKIADEQQTFFREEDFLEDLEKYCSQKVEKERGKAIAKLKTDKGIIKANERFDILSQELLDVIYENPYVIQWIVSAINTAVEIKNAFIDKLKDAKFAFETYYKTENGIEAGAQEGIAVSDDAGNIVKLVDRTCFSFHNRSTTTIKGWQRPGEMKESMIRIFEAKEEEPTAEDILDDISAEDEEVVNTYNEDDEDDDAAPVSVPSSIKGSAYQCIYEILNVLTENSDPFTYIEENKLSFQVSGTGVATVTYNVRENLDTTSVPASAGTASREAIEQLGSELKTYIDSHPDLNLKYTEFTSGSDKVFTVILGSMTEPEYYKTANKAGQIKTPAKFKAKYTAHFRPTEGGKGSILDYKNAKLYEIKGIDASWTTQIQECLTAYVFNHFTEFAMKDRVELLKMTNISSLINADEFDMIRKGKHVDFPANDVDTIWPSWGSAIIASAELLYLNLEGFYKDVNPIDIDDYYAIRAGLKYDPRLDILLSNEAYPGVARDLVNPADIILVHKDFDLNELKLASLKTSSTRKSEIESARQNYKNVTGQDFEQQSSTKYFVKRLYDLLLEGKVIGVSLKKSTNSLSFVGSKGLSLNVENCPELDSNGSYFIYDGKDAPNNTILGEATNEDYAAFLKTNIVKEGNINGVYNEADGAAKITARVNIEKGNTIHQNAEKPFLKLTMRRPGPKATTATAECQNFSEAQQGKCASAIPSVLNEILPEIYAQRLDANGNFKGYSTGAEMYNDYLLLKQYSDDEAKVLTQIFAKCMKFHIKTYNDEFKEEMDGFNSTICSYFKIS